MSGLNLPRLPEEASGTSGMKAAANGAMNASTLDGWWAEAWQDLNQAETPGNDGWRKLGRPSEPARANPPALRYWVGSHHADWFSW